MKELQFDKMVMPIEFKGQVTVVRMAMLIEGLGLAITSFDAAEQDFTDASNECEYILNEIPENVDEADIIAFFKYTDENEQILEDRINELEIPGIAMDDLIYDILVQCVESITKQLQQV